MEHQKAESERNTNRLYSKDQIEEWASKRADDCGRVSRQLLDTMRALDMMAESSLKASNVAWSQVDILRAENERLWAACKAVDVLWSDDAKEVKAAYDFEMQTMSPVGKVWEKVREALSNKDSEHG